MSTVVGKRAAAEGLPKLRMVMSVGFWLRRVGVIVFELARRSTYSVIQNKERESDRMSRFSWIIEKFRPVVML